MPATTGGSQELQPPAASPCPPPKPVPATSLCPQIAFLQCLQLKIQTLPHPSRDSAPVFLHKTPLWFSLLLVAPSPSSCTGCSQEHSIVLGKGETAAACKAPGGAFWCNTPVNPIEQERARPKGKALWSPASTRHTQSHLQGGEAGYPKIRAHLLVVLISTVDGCQDHCRPPLCGDRA